jgi:hypothetical protein
MIFLSTVCQHGFASWPSIARGGTYSQPWYSQLTLSSIFSHLCIFHLEWIQTQHSWKSSGEISSHPPSPLPNHRSSTSMQKREEGDFPSRTSLPRERGEEDSSRATRPSRRSDYEQEEKADDAPPSRTTFRSFEDEERAASAENGKGRNFTLPFFLKQFLF